MLDYSTVTPATSISGEESVTSAATEPAPLRLLLANFRYELSPIGITSDQYGPALFATLSRYLSCPTNQAGVVTALPRICPAAEYVARNKRYNHDEHHDTNLTTTTSNLANSMSATATGEINSLTRPYHHHAYRLPFSPLLRLNQLWPGPGRTQPVEVAKHAQQSTATNAENWLFYDPAQANYHQMAAALLAATGITAGSFNESNSVLVTGYDHRHLDKIVIIPPLDPALAVALGHQLAHLLHDLDPYVDLALLTATTPYPRIETID